MRRQYSATIELLDDWLGRFVELLRSHGRLYDLEEDPYELANVAEARPEDAKRFYRTLMERLGKTARLMAIRKQHDHWVRIETGELRAVIGDNDSDPPRAPWSYTGDRRWRPVSGTTPATTVYGRSPPCTRRPTSPFPVCKQATVMDSAPAWSMRAGRGPALVAPSTSAGSGDRTICSAEEGRLLVQSVVAGDREAAEVALAMRQRPSRSQAS